MTTQQQIPPMVSEYHGRTGEVLQRLQELHPTLIDLSLNRLEILLKKLGNPEKKLPPLIHVAGTNGKGSTCATMRAIAEAGGLSVHVMSSPHLLNVTERFRIAGNIVSEEALIETLEEIEKINQKEPITVFEVLTAAGFLLFSRHHADLALIEVGLGGRFDATNLIPPPKACIITNISLDHQSFLGDDLLKIAFEKAGIIKEGTPTITAEQNPEILSLFKEITQSHKADFFSVGQGITIEAGIENQKEHLLYRDQFGTLLLPYPSLIGAHQLANSAIAIAGLRMAGFDLPEQAFQKGMRHIQWPARLQTLHGLLAQKLPPHWELILDGGHNEGASHALADYLHSQKNKSIHLIIGLKATKDATAFLRPLLPYAKTLYIVQEAEQHLAMPINSLLKASEKLGKIANQGPTIKDAIEKILQKTQKDSHHAHLILICGSLYLAGCALKQDGLNTL